ncbi:uncharacterized protein TRIADDRAFT_59390 [Trichoplax adhaerens]|uniref:PSI domain-containing protein n=1 Tax=Trichoplax adhaerens TaxID=10228 RepID=B3S4Y3_TRIAD|nr:hypothetical protein TRIADDRAFT_59390 [Trichoplax adhaerens]EDV22289.1 hypothetical protein TRIADDRAFT_59390 [Trichoplax adhaerens]|eukprot:XP_002115444.1 hypothetical protein TRIADDRAFT_59390 [Trichoplax adhaerens]
MWRLVGIVLLACSLLPIQGKSTKPSKADCFPHNNTCGDCVAIKHCYYCSKTDVCWYYNPTFQHFIPPDSECPKADAFQGQCLFSTTVLIIAISSGAGVLIIAISCTIYCCCCRKNKKKYLKEEQRHLAEIESRRTRNEQRKVERQAKRDDIRRKYGLLKDEEDAGYNRLS